MNDEVLKRYIEGWLQIKENKKFKKHWCVLKGKLLNSTQLLSAFLFCFKDQNTHVREHFVGSYQINLPEHTVQLISCKGDKPMKYEFVIYLNQDKMSFIADDELSQERWIYALVDLVGNGLPPSDLPTVQNDIRSKYKRLCKSGQKMTKGKMKRAETMPAIRSTSSAAAARDSFAITNTNLRATLDEEDLFSQSLDAGRIKLMKASEILNTVPWYHGDKDREDAESLLDSNPIGAYLLRNHQFDSYTLSYKDATKIKHHIIKKIGRPVGYQFEMSEINKVFESPQDAVEFYMDMISKTTHFRPHPVPRNSIANVNIQQPRDARRRSSGRLGNPYIRSPGSLHHPDMTFFQGAVTDYQTAHLPPTPNYHRASLTQPPQPNATPTSLIHKRLEKTQSVPQPHISHAARPKLTRVKTEEETDQYIAMSSPMVPRISSDMKFANKPMISPKNHNADDDYYLRSVDVPTDRATMDGDQDESPYLQSIDIQPTGVRKTSDDFYLPDSELEQNGCRSPDYQNLPAPHDPTYVDHDNDDSDYVNNEVTRHRYAATAHKPPPPIPPRTMQPQRISNDVTYYNMK